MQNKLFGKENKANDYRQQFNLDENQNSPNPFVRKL